MPKRPRSRKRERGPVPQMSRGGLHLRAPRARRLQHAGVVDRIAGPVEAPAQAVQHHDEVLGHVRARRHVDAGARHRGATRTGREEPRRGCHQGRRNLGARRDVLGRVVGDRRAQRVHPVQVRRDERTVVEAFLQDHPDHAGEQRRILAGTHLQMEVGAARQLRPARIDRDDLHPAPPRVAQVLEGVGVRRTAVAGEGGDAGIVADEEHDVGVGEALHAGIPAPVPRPGRLLRRLVDGVRREVPVRADRVRPGDDQRLRGTEEPVRAGVDGDGARAVARDELGETRGHLVHRGLARHLDERAVGRPFPGAAEAGRMGVLRGELAPLHAQVALGDDVCAVATDVEHAAVLDVDLDAADRVAEPAERFVGLDHRRATETPFSGPARRGRSPRAGHRTPPPPPRPSRSSRRRRCRRSRGCPSSRSPCGSSAPRGRCP